METSFVTTLEQAKRLSEVRPAVSFQLKRERFVALGLGLGLGDCHEARIDLGGGERVWRLISVEEDPAIPSVVDTTWVPAPDLGR